MIAHAGTFAALEIGKARFLDRTGVEAVAVAGVMNDAAVTDVDAVVLVPSPRGYQVSADR